MTRTGDPWSASRPWWPWPHCQCRTENSCRRRCSFWRELLRYGVVAGEQPLGHGFDYGPVGATCVIVIDTVNCDIWIRGPVPAVTFHPTVFLPCVIGSDAVRLTGIENGWLAGNPPEIAGWMAGLI